MYILTLNLLLLAVILANDRPALSSERVSHIDKCITVKQKLISDYETQMELDTKWD
jgi:hypothetical protein